MNSVTKPDDALSALASGCGILLNFRDLAGKEQPTSPETLKALLRANGFIVDNEAATRELLAENHEQNRRQLLPDDVIVQSAHPFCVELPIDVQWQLTSTDSDTFYLEGRAGKQLKLPGLCSGIYQLSLSSAEHSQVVNLLAAPSRSPSLTDIGSTERVWGISAALYGLVSDRNTGVGDFVDLGGLCAGMATIGAAYVGTNPLHALGAESLEVISPYSPSHRGMLDTNYIALDAIPGLTDSHRAQLINQQALAASNEWRKNPLIDYIPLRRNHSINLRTQYQCFLDESGDEQKRKLEAFKASDNSSLHDFVLFEAISSHHGVDWRDWPEDLRNRHPATLQQIREHLLDELGFHYWAQWVANCQLDPVSQKARLGNMSVGLYLDLAVGSRRGGAESWCEQASIATGVSVGAPPDHLSPEGQNWQLTAFAPKKLQALQYRPYQLMLRSVMQHAKLLRIDHVLGLSRSFWIPDDGARGAYIKQPFESLMAVIKIEADRAGTVIIGEDLGLVPEGFRESIHAAGFYGYSVLQYEKGKDKKFRKPSQVHPQSLSCFATHDTPTAAGFEAGRDIDWWLKLGWIGEKKVKKIQKIRSEDVQLLKHLEDGESLIPPDATHVEQRFVHAVHSSLATGAAALVSIQLDDILEIKDAQNLPGTTDEHPNWRRRYPLSLESLTTLPSLNFIKNLMQKAGR